MKNLFVALWMTLWSTLGMAAGPEAGRDYTPINPPMNTDAKGKIEVIEFFSYGCPHCAEFNPVLHKWAARLPKDVSVRRVPVTFNRAIWVRLSKLYFALEAGGDLAKLDDAVFVAIHRERAPFNTDEAVIAWVGSKGGDSKRFADMMSSFAVQSKQMRAEQEVAAARINGVPALAIDGKFLIGSEGGYEHMLKTADALIDKARQERKK
ncbi:MAG TPA: thiol:disulfide interchange protein DsbA/DsbL [Rhodocyclaceae bacterium]|nr:thiol:disulfide interchange protein DsbA/DsbL [Rhodocyclaceae bacterium]